jgi:aryl-alcohol dehydrogenase-like predicted oxidoreductase
VGRILDAAQAQGINFVDTAPSYTQGQSEEWIGQALQGRRQAFVVASKFQLQGIGDHPVRAWIEREAEASLRRLQTDCIDLYQVHFPHPTVRAEEILRALEALVQAGKVREIGCCNYSSCRMLEAAFTARTLGTRAFVTAQNRYSLLERRPEEELLPFCAAYGVSLLPYYPLAGGFLTGKYRPGEPPPPNTRGAAGARIVQEVSTEPNWARLPALEQFARELGHPLHEVAITWLLAHSEVGSVIAGVTSPAQVAANARAAAWSLTPAQREALEALAPRPPEGAVEVLRA